MAFTPAQYTNGPQTRVAETASEATELEFDGWWAVGGAEPYLPLTERFAFGPTRPKSPRRGTVYIATPV